MGRHSIRFALAACALLVACQPKPAETPDADAAEKQTRADVTALIESWAKASSDGDWDAVGKLYADDEGFVWVERGAVRYPTRDAAIAGLEGVKAAGSKIATTVSEITVTPLAGDAAAFRTRVKFTADFGTEAPPVNVDAILTGVAFDYDTGWKILQAHMESRPVPVAAPAPPTPPT
jgi:ketosteroid isomerase-like protein